MPEMYIAMIFVWFSVILFVKFLVNFTTGFIEGFKESVRQSMEEYYGQKMGVEEPGKKGISVSCCDVQ